MKRRRRPVFNTANHAIEQAQQTSLARLVSGALAKFAESVIDTDMLNLKE
jgi:hypothetical protein